MCHSAPYLLENLVTAETLLDYYDALLREHEWLKFSPMSWTIIEEMDEKQSLEEIGERLCRGSDFRFEELAVRETPDLLEEPCLFIQTTEDGFWFLDVDDVSGTQQKLLSLIGVNSRFWSVAWPAAAPEYRFVYAERGQGKICLDDFRLPSGVYDGVPVSLAHHMDQLASAWISKPRRYRESVILALMTMETGVELESDWLNGVQLAIISLGLV